MKKEGENDLSIIMEKEEAHKIIDRMPPNATWDDLIREIYVREAVGRGLADSKAGRTKDVREIRAKYGLPEGVLSRTCGGFGMDDVVVPVSKPEPGVSPLRCISKYRDTFYLAVNIRGLHSEIPYDRQSDGSCKTIQIGRTLTIKLLDLSEGQIEWVPIGSLELSEIRNGFWHQTLRNLKSLETYAMIGVFDDNIQNPFKFEGNKILEGQPLPMLWKWLHNVLLKNRKSTLGNSKNTDDKTTLPTTA